MLLWTQQSCCTHGSGSRVGQGWIKQELLRCSSGCYISGRSYQKQCVRSGFAAFLKMRCHAWLKNAATWWSYVQVAAAASNFRSFWYPSNLLTFLDYRQISCCLLNGGIKNIAKKILSLSESSTFKELTCFHLKLKICNWNNVELRNILFPQSQWRRLECPLKSIFFF